MKVSLGRSLPVVLLGVALALLLGFTPTGHVAAVDVEQPPPTTEFEDTDGAQWTSHEGELEFLAAVDAGSDRVTVTEIGRTDQGRPLHLVAIGDPAPRTAAAALRQPTALFVCSQHGNEPAPREACLQWLRDLAFTDDAELVDQLGGQTILFVPTANPDGRAANRRGNASGRDINRDHIALVTAEAQAIHTVIRDWRPDVAADLHEYGPQIPVVYDDDILYLWSRNLNVAPQVYELARALAEDYIAKGAERAGYSADEYGILAASEEDLYQLAGGPDEGIARNAFGLRHMAAVLVESAVDPDPRNSPDELVSDAANRQRRVASQRQAISDTLRFMRDVGPTAAFASADAREAKAAEGREQSAPVYFGGADNSEPAPEDVVDPPPCEYLLDAATADDIAGTLDLHDIASRPRGASEVVVDVGQAAEPVIPLLLDARGSRSVADATPVYECAPAG